MSRSNNASGFASLMALFVGAVFLALAMGTFNATRSALRFRFMENDGLARKMYRSSLFPAFVELSADMPAGTHRGFQVEGIEVEISRNAQSADFLVHEVLVVIAIDHPEWGRLVITRMGTTAGMITCVGEKD